MLEEVVTGNHQRTGGDKHGHDKNYVCMNHHGTKCLAHPGPHPILSFVFEVRMQTVKNAPNWSHYPKHHNIARVHALQAPLHCVARKW